MRAESNKDQFRSGAALMIGVGDYPADSQIPMLPFAAKDAEAIATLFTDETVCNFAPDNVKLLADADATRGNIVGALSNWLPASAQRKELAVVFLAGHGFVHRHGVNEDGYFLSFDADPGNIAANGVSMRDIVQWIEGIDASAVVVFLDCCHSGKAVFVQDRSLSHSGVFSQSLHRQFGVQPEVFNSLAGRRRFVIASCDGDQLSIESAEHNHGLFTHHVLRGIAGAADSDGDGRVDVTELFNYVSEAVTREARERFDREQVPWTHATWHGKVFLSGGDLAKPPAIQEKNNVGEKWTEKIEQELPRASDDFLIASLNEIRKSDSVECVHIVFHCLAHRSEDVRLAGRATLKSLKWSRASEQILKLADERARTERIDYILEGLAAIEAHSDVVALLDRLVTVLDGNLWQRTVFLLERKRLGLTFNDVAESFRDSGSSYALCDVLGAGLFTAAYLASRRSTDIQFVVRVLRPEFAGDARIRRAFLDTSQSSFELHHQSLVHTRDFGGYPDKCLYYIVRDYVNGPTLREILAKGRHFEPVQCIRILQQVVRALKPFHEATPPHLHGGIKPSNIFLTREAAVVLGDPSLPVPPPNTELDRLGYDFRYVAPESFRTYLSSLTDQTQPDFRADYYSFGCVAYELLCQTAPFVANNHYELFAKHDRDRPLPPTEVNSELGSLCNEMIATLLAKSPGDRYSSTDEVEAVLARVLLELERRSTDSDAGGDGPAGDSGPPHDAGPSATPGGLALVDESETTRPQDDGTPLSEAMELSGIMDDASLARYEPPKSIMSMIHTILAGEPSPQHHEEQSPYTMVPPRYEVQYIIGQGGMGTVVRAYDSALRRSVAIKMLRHAHFRNRTQFILREAQAAAQLSHPNIVSVHDAGEWEGQPYVVMEYVDGPTLHELIREKGPSSNRQVVRIVSTVSAAIGHAHSIGLVHRDVKPSNVLIAPDGTPKICDFGLAKQLDAADSLVETGQIVGTLAYMSPEQTEGSDSVGPPSDVYSIGAMLYEILTGRRPFSIDGANMSTVLLHIRNSEPMPPRRINPDIPRDLESVCLKCLSKHPSDRYANGRELAEELDRFMSKKPISARPPSTIIRLFHWMRRNPLGTAFVLASLIAIAAASALIALVQR